MEAYFKESECKCQEKNYGVMHNNFHMVSFLNFWLTAI